jgi:PEP-CTERM motif
MRNTLVAALGAAIITTFGVSSGAHAALINFSAAVFGTVTYTGASLDTSNSINLDGSALVVGETGVGDDSGLKHFDTVAISPSDIVYGSETGPGTLPGSGVFKTWTTTDEDKFTETLTTVDSINRGTTNAITIRLSGTVSDTSGIFVDTPIFLILSANQVGGPHTALSVLFTDTSVVAGVPEASTWAMMGLGFAGLGYTASRRRKTIGGLLLT